MADVGRRQPGTVPAPRRSFADLPHELISAITEYLPVDERLEILLDYPRPLFNTSDPELLRCEDRVDFVALRMLSSVLLEEYKRAAFREAVIRFSDTSRASRFFAGEFDGNDPLLRRVRPEIKRIRIDYWDFRRSWAFGEALRYSLDDLRALHVGKPYRVFDDGEAEYDEDYGVWKIPEEFMDEKYFLQYCIPDVARRITPFVLKYKHDWCSRVTFGTAKRFGDSADWEGGETYPWFKNFKCYIFIARCLKVSDDVRDDVEKLVYKQRRDDSDWESDPDN
ncbi:hypothetical protein NpNSSI1_00000628 [Neofusicoccum parvum]|nr:hypothetical protein NpNSSI1_00000628 [Neofusicoccum parvum]